MHLILTSKCSALTLQHSSMDMLQAISSCSSCLFNPRLHLVCHSLNIIRVHPLTGRPLSLARGLCGVWSGSSGARSRVQLSRVIVRTVRNARIAEHTNDTNLNFSGRLILQFSDLPTLIHLPVLSPGTYRDQLR